MEYEIRPVTPEDRAGIIDIFNYYIEHTFAAYPEQKVPGEFFGMLMQLAKGYPFYVAESGKAVVGYGLLRPHSPISSFRRTAELTCFIAPDFTGKGIGQAILGRLVADAKAMGIDTILASISSANEGSIRFHRKYGFTECGTFRRAGKKFGRDFDETWMQLHI
ncbi:MAG: Acetyltransferase (GNAT) family protein [Methanocella sp. PtaU1.Bin125]|nr:MAG: Acetyltransferase (GNAT) family protein [Methanocella sp. PtaU1.Bin125]